MSRISIQRLVPLLFCQLVFFFAVAQKQTTVTVKVYNNCGSSVSFYKVENGEARRMSFRWPKVNDTCVFTFPLEEEGTYYLSKTGGKGSAYHYVVYLKPGE